MFNLKNIFLVSKNRKQYKSRVLLRSRCRCCSGIPCPCSYASRSPPNSVPLLHLMMEGKSRADVATLRCYCLLTVVLVDPTSRRWDVTTWGRRDAPDLFMHSLHMLQNCFQQLPFCSNVPASTPNTNSRV